VALAHGLLAYLLVILDCTYYEAGRELRLDCLLNSLVAPFILKNRFERGAVMVFSSFKLI
jgi:hypothetical protein